MRVMGIDGCPGGWFVVETDGEGDYDCRIADSIDTALSVDDPPTLALVDIPIGLLESPGQRACDRLARRALSPRRHASVFTPPSRQALDADSYPAANDKNRTAVGKGLQRQAWHLAGKIRSVERLMSETGAFRGVLRESHPEVCFWGVTGEPMANHKGTDDGRRNRLAVLTTIDPAIESAYLDACERFQRRMVGRDDIIDALCLALVARGGHQAEALCTLPADPPTDPRGFPMEMVYWPRARETIPSSIETDPDE